MHVEIQKYVNNRLIYLKDMSDVVNDITKSQGYPWESNIPTDIFMEQSDTSVNDGSIATSLQDCDVEKHKNKEINNGIILDTEIRYNCKLLIDISCLTTNQTPCEVTHNGLN